ITRRMLPVYVAGVVTLIGYLGAAPLMRDIENKTIAALIDPIGSEAIRIYSRYWTAAEKNTLQIPITDVILWNRALWLAIGIAIFALCYWRFRMAYAVPERRGKKAKIAAALAAAESVPAQRAVAALPESPRNLSSSAYLRALPGLVRLYFRETVKNI